jgi:stage II sporulation protein D
LIDTFRSASPLAMRRISLLSALFLLLLPGASQAAVRIVVRGAGFGHGIGLSQYGAFGYAQHGRSYRDILGHYYTGTQLSEASSRPVRVLLQSGRSAVSFRGGIKVSGPGKSKRISPSRTYVVRQGGGGLTVKTAHGKLLGRFPSPIRVPSGQTAIRLFGGGINGVQDGVYHGGLDLSRSGGGVTAINVLPLDWYVQGVVPGEMPSAWSFEALKSQAVAARSYALATIKPGAGFDLYPDTRSQVYRGVGAERPSTNAAVRSTARQILTSGGRVVITYYFSTSGGETENVENSFLGSPARSWLRGVDDPYDGISPRHRWRFTFTPRQLQTRLSGYVAGRFRKIVVLSRGVSPRVIRARVVGSKGSHVINGPTLRTRLGLFDSWAYFSRVSSAQGSALRFARAGVLVRRPALVGAFDPAPRGRRLLLERRRGRGWRRVATIRTSSHGSYRVGVPARGVYRVRAGKVAGPAVRVR